MRPDLRRTLRRAHALPALVVLALPAACGRHHVQFDPEGNIAPDDARMLVASFAPQALRVHPLSRAERDAKGRLRIACHVELLDRFGHASKWPLRLRVELLPANPTPPSTPSTPTPPRPAVYAVDLLEPDDNARSYDWISRTYTLLLGDLPPWVENSPAPDPSAPDATPDAAAGAEPAIVIQVFAQILQPDGAYATLQDTLRIPIPRSPAALTPPPTPPLPPAPLASSPSTPALTPAAAPDSAPPPAPAAPPPAPTAATP